MAVSKQLGEIALRVEDLDTMQAFYTDVVGLPLLRRFPTSAFFTVADGFAGHTQIVALFDRQGSENYTNISPAATTVDHFAFTIDKEDFASERERLLGLGLQVDESTHAWVQWRSLYITDPEGNRVEFVCYDETVPPE